MKTNFLKDALPYLEDGAFFVLQPEKSKNGRLIRKYRIRLRYSCGEYVEGCWGQAKKDAAKKRILRGFYFEGDQAWRINESFSGL